jgi:hypothetical protein
MRMKKILLCSVLAAFACASAVQAGEKCASTCSASKATTCSKATAKKSDGSVKGAQLLVRK